MNIMVLDLEFTSINKEHKHEKRILNFEWIGEEDAIINSWSKTDKEQIINKSLLKVYHNY